MQEFNSIEAIKGAVQHGLGAAFVSAAAIQKETALGLLHHLPITDVHLTRTISLVCYCYGLALPHNLPVNLPCCLWPSSNVMSLSSCLVTSHCKLQQHAPYCMS